MINPRKKGKRVASTRRKRRPPKGFKTWKSYMASIRPGARKRRRKRSTGASTVAKRKRKRTRRAAARSSAPRRRRRRRGGYRRNPRMNVVRRVIDGATHAAFAVAGKAAANAVPNLIPGIPATGPARIAAQLAVGVGLGLVAERLPLPRGAADFVVAGALMAPIEDIVSGLPLIGPALSSYPLSSYPLNGGMVPNGRRLNALPSERPQAFGDYGYTSEYAAGYYY